MDWQIPNQIENMGGINFFQFIEIDKILTFPRQFLGEIGLISLKEGNDWSAGYGIQNTLELNVTPQKDNQGTIFNVMLSGEYPGASAAQMEEFRNMLNRKYIVLIKDSSGKTKVLGSLEEPLEFNYSEKTGKAASDRPGVLFSFEGKCSNTPYHYYIEISIPTAPVLE